VIVVEGTNHSGDTMNSGTRQKEQSADGRGNTFPVGSETTDSVDIATQMVPRVVLPDDGHGRGKKPDGN
jgi:hypothetical protein